MQTLAAKLGCALGLTAALAPALAQPATTTAEDWREHHAYTLGVQACIFGFPYVDLSTYRWQWVTQAP